MSEVENLTPQEGDVAKPAEGTPAAGDGEGIEDLTPQTPSSEATPKQAAEDTESDEATQGAPETYETFELPEGVEVDEEALEGFLPLAKELNLSQEEAQKLVTFQANLQDQVSKSMQESFDNTLVEWEEAARGDKEVGGPEFDKKLATARKAIERFGTKQLLEALDATGVGNHPELIRFMYRVGKIVEDDKFHFGNSPQQERTAANVLFPSMKQE